MQTLKVTSLKQLKDIIKKSPDDADLNHLDVSKIKSMKELFHGSKFNGNISEWDLSNVTDNVIHV